MNHKNYFMTALACVLTMLPCIYGNAQNQFSAPSLKWITEVQGQSFDHSKGNDVDSEGNVFVSSTYSSLTFNEKISFPNTGTPEAMVAKLNGTTGEPLWAKRIGGEDTGNEQGQSVCADPATGNSVWTGIVTANALLGTMEQSSPLVTNGARDIFLVKMDPSGGVIWAQAIGSSANWEAGLNTQFDRKGNIYLAGYKYKKPIELSGADGGIVILEGTKSSMILVKFNGDGKALWGKVLPTAAELYGLVTDAQNNIYTSGIIDGSIDFGNNKQATSSGKAVFVAKFSEEGDCEWATVIGEEGNTLPGRGKDLTIDSQGNLYMATVAQGTVTYGSSSLISVGGTDAVVFKLSPEGDVLSHIQIGSEKDDGGITVKTDADDNLYVSGYYAGTFSLGTDNTLELPAGVDISAFVAKYTAAGDCVWGFSSGSSQSPGIMMTSLALCIEPSTNDVIVSGNTNNGKIYAHAYTGNTAYASGDYFIARYSQSMGVYATLPDGKLDVAYEGKVKVTGCRYPENISYSLTQGALPPGLAFNTSTGEVSGTPSSAGKWAFTVEASDGTDSASKEFTIEIFGSSDCELAIDPILSLPSCVNGQAFSLTVYASLGTGDVTWGFDDISKVPKGLAIQSKDSETGVLSGVPNTPPGVYTFVLTASDEADCVASISLTLTVTGDPVSIRDEEMEQQGVFLYPGIVTGGRLFLHLAETGGEPCTVSVYDTRGVRLSKAQLTAGRTGDYPVSVGQLASGLYVLTVYSKEKYIGSFRFVVKK